MTAGLTVILGKTTHFERALMIVAGLVLVYPSLLQDVVGLSLFGLAVFMQYRRSHLVRN